MIKIENLSKNYGKNHVLKNISIDLNSSKVIGIVGENGAGKTTLFRCIAGLEKFEGSISSDFDILKNHIGFLPTIPFYFSKITGKEYLQLLANARDIKLDNIEERNIFDLPLNQYASTYSTGMKKKLALTAILLQKNDVFILDEPFNGVDIQSNILITSIIQELKKLGKTIIISSHIFSTLADNCDEIHLLKEGEFIKKVEKGNFKDLESEMMKSQIGDKISRLVLS